MFSVQITPNIRLDLSKLGGVQKGSDDWQLIFYSFDPNKSPTLVRFDRKEHAEEVLNKLRKYFNDGEFLVSDWEEL